MKSKPKKLDYAIERLYKAVDYYVKRNGGSVLIVGGISIQQWPGASPNTFYVAIQCVGRLPEFAGKQSFHSSPPPQGEPVGFLRVQKKKKRAVAKRKRKEK